MPAIDGYTIGSGVSWNVAGNDYVFLYPGYQSVPQPALAFDDEIVLVHGNCAVAQGIHRNWLQSHCSCLVNIINHFSCWQKTVKAVGNELRRHRRKRNSGK